MQHEVEVGIWWSVPRRSRFDISKRRLYVFVASMEALPLFGERRLGPYPAIIDTGAPVSVFPRDFWTKVAPDRIIVLKDDVLPAEFADYEGHLMGLGSYRRKDGTFVGALPCYFGFVQIWLVDHSTPPRPFVVPAALSKQDTVLPKEDLDDGQESEPVPLILGVGWLLDTFRVDLNRASEGRERSSITIESSKGWETVTIKELREEFKESLGPPS